MARRKQPERDYIDDLLDAPESMPFLGRDVRMCAPPLAELRRISNWYRENLTKPGAIMGLYAKCANAVLAEEPGVRSRTADEWERVLHVHKGDDTDAFIAKALDMCGFKAVSDGIEKVAEQMRTELTPDQEVGDVPTS